MQRGEAADIGPVDVEPDRRDVCGSLATRDRLHDSVIDRGLQQPRIDLAEPVRVLGQLQHFGVRLRQQNGQLIQQRRGAPDEHAGVPPVAPRGQVLFGGFLVGLLGEIGDQTGRAVALEVVASGQIAVARVRAGRYHAEGDQHVRIIGGQPEARLQCVREGVHGGDQLVGGHHRDHRLWVAASQHSSRPGDRVE